MIFSASKGAAAEGAYLFGLRARFFVTLASTRLRRDPQVVLIAITV